MNWSRFFRFSCANFAFLRDFIPVGDSHLLVDAILQATFPLVPASDSIRRCGRIVVLHSAADGKGIPLALMNNLDKFHFVGNIKSRTIGSRKRIPVSLVPRSNRLSDHRLLRMLNHPSSGRNNLPSGLIHRLALLEQDLYEVLRGCSRYRCRNLQKEEENLKLSGRSN